MAHWDLFNHQRLHAGKRVLMIGGTTCGKTTAMHQIAGAMHCNEKRREWERCEKARKSGKKCVPRRGGIQLAIGFSKTERANGNLGGPIRDGDDDSIKHKFSIMPSWCANHGFIEAKLAEFMEYAIATKEVGRMKTSLVVMDDVMSQKGVKNSAVLNEFMQNARNYGCGMIQCQHSVKQASVDARTQFHYVVCYEIAADQMKQFYDVFASRVFPTFKVFRQTWMTMNKKLGQYWALVIDLQNAANSGELQDRVFKFRAKNPDDADYHIPHLCEMGCWWIDRRLKQDAKSKASLRELFDLAAVAQEKHVDLGMANAEAARRTAAAAADAADAASPTAHSVLLPMEDEELRGAGGSRRAAGTGSGTVLEGPQSIVELRI